MTRSDTRSTVAVCALLSIVLAAALAGPAAASSTSPAPASTTTHADMDADPSDGPCVIVSTDPPGVAVHTKCSGSGTLFLNGQSVP